MRWMLLINLENWIDYCNMKTQVDLAYQCHYRVPHVLNLMIRLAHTNYVTQFKECEVICWINSLSRSENEKSNQITHGKKC